jgi:hypothetical protein
MQGREEFLRDALARKWCTPETAELLPPDSKVRIYWTNMGIYRVLPALDYMILDID